MRASIRKYVLSAMCLFGVIGTGVNAEPITIAVASNFAPIVPDIAMRFRKETGQSMRATYASTGKLYAQILNGAPFDVLLAADVERPRLLEDSGHGVAGSRFTYAIGQLVLWSLDPALAGSDCRELLQTPGRFRLAIANPETAPYGAAAKETLISLDLWNRLQPQIVIGASIAKTFQFVATGSANLGFVASNQPLKERYPQTTCAWEVPPELHQPIEQQAILLKHGAKNPAAASFLNFLSGPSGREIIGLHGYTLPPRPPDE